MNARGREVAVLTRSTQPGVTGGLVGELMVAGKTLEVYAGRGALVRPGRRGQAAVRRRPQRSLRMALPSPPALIDRKAEVTAALGALEARLPLQFCGPHGVGKTTLLNATLRRVSSRFGPVLLFRAGTSPFSDLLQDLFDAYHEFDAPAKLTDAQLAQHLLNLQGVIGLDDVSLSREEVQVLIDLAPGCLFILVSEEDLLWGEGRTIPLSGVSEDAGLAILERGMSRPLGAEEREDARELWLTLQGNPGHLIQAGSFTREAGVSLRVVQELIRGSAPADTMAAAIVGTLSDTERRILSALICLRRVVVRPELMAAVTGVAGADAVLRSLVDRGMAEADGSGFLAVESPGARTALDADWWAEFLFRHLTAWCEDNRDDHRLLLQNADPLMWALAWGRAAGEWLYVVKLAHNLEPALAIGARWARWKVALQAGEEAARALEDKTAEASFLHQLGTRALCLDARSEASALLTQAIEVSEASDDYGLSSSARQNLQLVREQRPPSAPARPEPRGGAHRRAPRLALMVKVVAVLLAFLIPVGVLVWRQPTSAVIMPHPSGIDFGERTVGEVHRQRLTLTNSGPKPVTIDGAAVTPPLLDFSLEQTEDCTGKILGDDEACSLIVSFKPTATGRRVASVAIRSNAEDGKLVHVQIQGVGLPPEQGAALETQPSSLDFGIVPVGTSRVEKVRLISTGNEALSVGSASIVPPLPDYGLVHNCQGSLDRDDACTLTITFEPTAAGPRSARLTIEDNAAGAPHVIPLLGKGSPPPAGGPALELDKSSINFGRQVVGETSQPQTVTLNSVGDADLEIENVALGALDPQDFEVNSTCEGPVRPDAACTITVSFTPQAQGARRGSLTISHNMTGILTTVIPLSGTGSAQPKQSGEPAVELSHAFLTFAEVPAGRQATQTMTVTNVGTGPLEIGDESLDLTGADFDLKNDCTGSLDPAESCSIHVIFAPSSSGSKDGKLTLILNGNEQRVELTGVAIPAEPGPGEPAPGEPAVTLESTALDFGEVPLQASGQKVLTVTNSGQGQLTIDSIQILAATDEPIFTVDTTSSCSGATLSPEVSCVIAVAFSPIEEGDATATLQLFDNAPGSPQQVGLTGTGTAPPTPQVGVSPDRLEWVAGQAGEKTVVVTNNGQVPVLISGVAIEATNTPTFAMNETASTCLGATLTPGTTCQIAVGFAPPPGSAGEAAILKIIYDGGVATVALSGPVE